MSSQMKSAALVKVDTIPELIFWTTAMAGLTALASNVAVKLPFTPVPVTLQVFTVVLTGLVLGSRLGALSLLEYVIIGLAGAPVFAGGGCGAAYLAGPTGGYLIGFIAGAFLTGLVIEKAKSSSVSVFFLASLLGVIAIYFVGTSWLSVWLGTVKGVGMLESIPKAWALGAAPFVVIDIVKSLLAATAATGARRFRPIKP